MTDVTKIMLPLLSLAFCIRMLWLLLFLSLIADHREDRCLVILRVSEEYQRTFPVIYFEVGWEINDRERAIPKTMYMAKIRRTWSISLVCALHCHEDITYKSKRRHR